MTTADAAVPVAAEPKRGIRFGIWSLIFGLLPVVWAGVFALFGFAGGGNDGLEAAAEIMFFLAFVVIPLGIIVAIALGALALARNRSLGKILGGIGILLAIAVFVMSLVLLFGPGGPAGWTNF